MPVAQQDASSYLATHTGVLGQGWSEVDTFEALDPDEYDLEDVEEEYVTLDLGPEMDPKYLQTEGTYQLIGMDTALPHLKIGNTVLQGEITPLIGTEVILGLIRNEENPLRPSHPPLYTTDKRISFRPINIKRIDQSLPENTSGTRVEDGHGHGHGRGGEEEEEGEEEEMRAMFLKQDARYGPNKPEKLPGRKRDRDRAARRAERAVAGLGMEVDVGDDSEEMEEEEAETEAGTETMGMGMNVDVNHDENAIPTMDEDDFTTLSATTITTATATPGAGPSISPIRPNPIPSPVKYDMSRPNDTPIGRPRTRPVIEITSLPELAHLDISSLPQNIRITVLPHVIHELDPTTPLKDPMHLPQRPFEYTKGQIKKLVNPPTGAGGGSRKIQARRFTHLAPGEERSLPNSFSSSTNPSFDPGPGPGPGSGSGSGSGSGPRPSLGLGGGEGYLNSNSNSVISSNGSKVVTFNHRARNDVEFPQFVTSGPAPPPVVVVEKEKKQGSEAEVEAEVEAEKGEVAVGDIVPEMRLDIRDEEDAEARAT